MYINNERDILFPQTPARLSSRVPVRYNRQDNLFFGLPCPFFHPECFTTGTPFPAAADAHRTTLSPWEAAAVAGDAAAAAAASPARGDGLSQPCRPSRRDGGRLSLPRALGRAPDPSSLNHNAEKRGDGVMGEHKGACCCCCYCRDTPLAKVTILPRIRRRLLSISSSSYPFLDTTNI